ncbi:hypothetical protein [Actinoplanes siamensis]|uniref:Uncharacterized protein n=1 Tax=Actinoplanes siamensis TaxID=1223317 RepID=A0A919TP73_9ACTN|nr:hypothetical protein [Actinoplanes siamensis]GIF08888.1 hypothetical protein Asi03nite_64260 [Actinoplanes siamensis]
MAGHPRLLDDADGLAADLGYLPLALAQAAAYLLDRRLSCAGYRARLADQRRQLADLVPEEGALPDEHQATVAATWALSIDLALSVTAVTDTAHRGGAGNRGYRAHGPNIEGRPPPHERLPVTAVTGSLVRGLARRY